MASIAQSSNILRRYRWKELGLFIIPFMILLLEIIQLPLAQYYESTIRNTSQPIPFSTAILPTAADLVPVFGLIALLVGVNVLLSFTFPRADQMLLPLFVTYAELDPANFQPDSVKLIDERAREGKPVRSLRLAGHSHLSETYAVGSGDESLSAPVLEFIRSIGNEKASK